MTSATIAILYLEDEALDVELVQHALEAGQFKVQIDWVETFSLFQQALEAKTYDLIFADYSLPDVDGLKAVTIAKRLEPDIPYILVTGAITEDLAINTIKAGVDYYVLKSSLKRLEVIIPRALSDVKKSRERKQVLEELRTSEERFDLAVRGSGAGIWDWQDVAEDKLWWSPRIYEMLGFSETEFYPTHALWFTLIHPDDKDAFKIALEKHLSGQDPYDIEYRIRHKQGHYVWWRSRGKARFANGKACRMAGYVQDITERKIAQQSLVEQQRALLQAQLVGKIGSWAYDIPADQFFWTPMVYQFYQFRPETFDGRLATVRNRVHPKDIDWVDRNWQTALREGRCDYEFRLLIDDKIIWLRLVAEIDYDERRQPIRAIGVVHDITDKRLAEEEQRKANEKYRAISRSAQDAIIIIDSSARVNFWNPAAEKIFGYSEAEVLGQDIHQLLLPEKVRERPVKKMQHFAATGEGDAIGKMVEVEGLNKQGETVHIEMALNAIFQDGQWQAIGVLRDVTERKKAENERRILESQLRQAQKMEAIGTLAGGIAHDFNNILASILGYTSLAEKKLADGSQERRDLQEVLRAANRAKQLVSQILTISRKSELERKPIFVDLIAREALRLLRASLPSDIELKYSLNSETGPVFGDATQLHQVLMNLCVNAFHAMPKGGTLTVSLDEIEMEPNNIFGLPPGLNLELVVSDTGTGISPEIVDRIYDPYFTTKDVDRGTGLGLSIVRSIIDGMDGYVGVESELGQGTRFRILLPRCNTSVVDDGIAEGQEIIGGHEEILFIDDEEQLAKLGKDFLEEIGYRVSVQFNGIEALAQVQENPDRFDLVITDQTMPKMTGIELAKQLRQVAPDLPVILCSGLTYSLDTEEITKTNIRAYVLKTEVISRLPQIIREVFDK